MTRLHAASLAAIMRGPLVLCCGSLLCLVLAGGCGTRVLLDHPLEWKGKIILGERVNVQEGQSLLVRVVLPSIEGRKDYVRTVMAKPTESTKVFEYSISVDWYKYANYRVLILMKDPSNTSETFWKEFEVAAPERESRNLPDTRIDSLPGQQNDGGPQV